MRKSTSIFFDRWKQKSDSICGALDTSNELSIEIRDIYEAVLKKSIEENFDFELKHRDSIHYKSRKDVSFDETLNYLRSLKLYDYSPRRFVMIGRAAYYDVVPVKSLQELKEYAHSGGHKLGDYKTVSMACIERTPYGRETLLLTTEYKAMLDAFMGVDTEKQNVPYSSDEYAKTDFLGAEIPVHFEHWGHGYHYNGFSAMGSVLFNEDRTFAVLNVMSSYASGGLYTLEKRDGKWVALRSYVSWIM